MLKRRFSEVFKDKILVGSIIISLTFTLLYTFEYLDNDKRITSLIRAITSIICFPLVFGFKHNGLKLWSVLFAYSERCINDGSHYISFVIIAFLCMISRKELKITFLLIYFAIVLCKTYLYSHDSYRIIIHLAKCACIYYTVFMFVKVERPVKKEHLQLLPDEQIILELLATGKRQNEITEYAPNTVSKKLKNAKIRNNIKHTDDLVLRYMDSDNRINFVNK